GERVIVCGDGFWELFDAAGRSRAAGLCGAGEVSVDEVNALFYHANAHGSIEAKRLSDGSHAFTLQTLFGPEFERSLIARRGRRLIVVGRANRSASRSTIPPALSLIESHDLGESPAVDDLGFLTPVASATSLTRATARLTAAFHHDTLVFGAPGEICFAEPDLRIRRRVEIRGEPLSLSLDETGDIYLQVRAEGQTSFQLISAEGERLTTFVLSQEEVGPQTIPPIVGHDHSIFLTVSNRLVAIGSHWQLLWIAVLAGDFAGAALGAGNQLLVSAGSAVLAYDTRGQPRTIFSVDGERLRTAPALTERGELLVAGEDQLYCLGLQNK
ncbi:MAG TPA: hypothetical protein VM870_07530, partial [Pyrinomonadaceae bacterium]|nr:hypothetical protein [Pyrinomonadaceae bacterium]